MNNELRNEVTIQLAGKTRTMRATFQAIRDIEVELGMPLPAIVSKFAMKQQGLNDLAVTIHHGLRAVDKDAPSVEEIGEAILEEGLNTAIVAGLDFMLTTMRGVNLPSGKSQKKAKT